MVKAKIIKKKVSEHQWKFRKKYGVTKKVFYIVKNPAGESIGSFSTKKQALKYQKKLGDMF